MRFTEIGQQLRAYRMESGVRAEEIAHRLGVSRAALYRYEKGEVIKLDTVNRLAELLKVSPLSLLGIGIEYYSRPVGYLERLRQLEESAERILDCAGPVCYLTTTDGYDHALEASFDDVVAQAGPDRPAMSSAVDQVLALMAERRKSYASRHPNIIAIVTITELRQFLAAGVGGGLPVSERVHSIGRVAARQEVAAIAAAMEAEPMGLQYGLLTGAEPSGRFTLLRTRDRASVAINPFQPDGHPAAPVGIAMVTGSDEAVTAHQRAAEAGWKAAIKGPAAAAEVRALLTEFPEISEAA
jgi:transcriptional regulator with XRE-family HTH domain